MQNAQQEQFKQKIEALRKLHPEKEVHLVLAAGKEFYVASPSREIWHAFKDAVADPKRKKVATENFVSRCAVEPAAEAIGALFEKKPALAETIANQLAKLAGIDEEAEVFFFSPD